MTRFAVVAPPQILDGLKENNLIGNTHLLLAHDVVARPEDYLKHFGPDSDMPFYAEQTEGRLVILDTSVIELGKPVDAQMIIEAAKITQPDVIVLPDIIGDAEATIDASFEALKDWTPKIGHWHRPSYMFVPQGKNFREYVECADVLADHLFIRWWGIPRDALKYMPTRHDLIRACYAMNPYRHIHMLGFSDNILDDVLSANICDVTSIDSAVPLRMGDVMSMVSRTPPRGNWWETAKFDEPEITSINLRRVRGWFGDYTFDDKRSVIL